MSSPDTTGSENEEEMLRLTLDLWHPNCWTIKTTKETDAGLLGYGVYTGMEGTAHGRFTVYGDSTAEVDALIEETKESPLTSSVTEIEKSWRVGEDEVVPPGNTTRELFVEFDPSNSIDEAFVSRGFVYDGPTRIKDGRETWSLVISADRLEVQRLLDEIRDEMDADIEVTQVSTPDHTPHGQVPNTMQLSDRQREVFLFARERGYYEWPREVTARELAEEFDITKTTFLEHLRKAESKLLNSVK